MTLTTDILTNLAANLATDLIVRAAGRLRDATFGDAETQALARAWEQTFRAMLDSVAAGLDAEHANLLDDLLHDFVSADGVADALLDLALEGREPPLEALRSRFDALEYDRAALAVDFDAALTALTRGLTDALLAEARQPDNPLYNRVSVVRAAAIHRLLRQQRQDLHGIAQATARLEEGLGTAKYNLVFLGPVSGMAVGDEAAVRLPPDQRDLLDEIRGLLTEMAAGRESPPYTEPDRAAYLQAVVQDCKTIDLPYDQEGQATLPLERIYVALKADLSSPAERRASYALLQQLAEEQAEGRPDAQALYRAARFDPYAARYLIYDPRLRESLLQAVSGSKERTYHLAQIVRRHRWVVLLGDPGSGKSTLARWLALQLARALQQEQEAVQVPGDHVRPDADPETRETLGPARLPVLVRVADYAAARWPEPGRDTELTLLNYLGRHMKEKMPPGRRTEALNALLRDYLAAGRVAFILDGLDEVTDHHQRQAIAAAIEDLIGERIRDAYGRSPLEPGYHPGLVPDSAQRGGNQIIVTSRIVGYDLRPCTRTCPISSFSPWTRWPCSVFVTTGRAPPASPTGPTT